MVMETGPVAVGLVIRFVVGKAFAFIDFGMDVGIAQFIIPFFIDRLFEGQFKAPFIFFIEVLRFPGRYVPIPADDVL